MKKAIIIMATLACLTATPSYSHTGANEGLDRKIMALSSALNSLRNLLTSQIDGLANRLAAFEIRLAALETPSSPSSPSPPTPSPPAPAGCSGTTTTTEYRRTPEYDQLCKSGVMGKVSYEERRDATTDCQGNVDYSRWILVMGQEAIDRNSRRTTPPNCL